MRFIRSRTTAAVASVAALAALATGCGQTSTPGITKKPSSYLLVPRELRFSTETVDGEVFRGKSLFRKDAVLWFWAPGCAACREEAQVIANADKKWGGEVTFVGMAAGGKTSEMKRFVSETGLKDMPHAVDTDDSVWSRFEVTTAPEVVFVDEGKVQAPRSLDEDRFDAEVEQLARD